MKKILSLVLTMYFVFMSCAHKQKLKMASTANKSKDCLPDSLSALIQGKKLLLEKYAYNDSTSITFSAVLTEDSIWHVVAKPKVFENKQLRDSIPINRGSDRVLINKHNCDVVGFFIAR